MVCLYMSAMRVRMLERCAYGACVRTHVCVHVRPRLAAFCFILPVFCLLVCSSVCCTCLFLKGFCLFVCLAGCYVCSFVRLFVLFRFVKPTRMGVSWLLYQCMYACKRCTFEKGWEALRKEGVENGRRWRSWPREKPHTAACMIIDKQEECTDSRHYAFTITETGSIDDGSIRVAVT